MKKILILLSILALFVACDKSPQTEKAQEMEEAKQEYREEVKDAEQDFAEEKADQLEEQREEVDDTDIEVQGSEEGNIQN